MAREPEEVDTALLAQHLHPGVPSHGRDALIARSTWRARSADTVRRTTSSWACCWSGC